MARKKKCEESRGTPEYMLTYGDMTTLLLTFFVFLVASSSINVQKFKLILSSFRGAIGVFQYGSTISQERLLGLGIPITKVRKQTKNLQRTLRIKQILKDELKGADMKIRIEQRGIVIQLTDQLLFEPGSADVSSKSYNVLRKIAYILNEVLPGRQVFIEGHTDNIPIRSAKFPSNWELSARRATNVLRILTSKFKVKAKRLAAAGYGPNRPIADNSTVEGRKQNRRVDIVILREDISKLVEQK